MCRANSKPETFCAGWTKAKARWICDITQEGVENGAGPAVYLWRKQVRLVILEVKCWICNPYSLLLITFKNHRVGFHEKWIGNSEEVKIADLLSKIGDFCVCSTKKIGRLWRVKELYIFEFVGYNFNTAINSSQSFSPVSSNPNDWYKRRATSFLGS